MQVNDTSKMYPCWRVYKQDDRLPIVSFRNGRRIDLGTSEIVSQLEKMKSGYMLMFYEHQCNGRYQRCTGKTEYLFGSNFSVSKNDDNSICVFGNGCSFE